MKKTIIALMLLMVATQPFSISAMQQRLNEFKKKHTTLCSPVALATTVLGSSTFGYGLYRGYNTGVFSGLKNLNITAGTEFSNVLQTGVQSLKDYSQELAKVYAQEGLLSLTKQVMITKWGIGALGAIGAGTCLGVFLKKQLDIRALELQKQKAWQEEEARKQKPEKTIYTVSEGQYVLSVSKNLNQEQRHKYSIDLAVPQAPTSPMEISSIGSYSTDGSILFNSKPILPKDTRWAKKVCNEILFQDYKNHNIQRPQLVDITYASNYCEKIMAYQSGGKESDTFSVALCDENKNTLNATEYELGKNELGKNKSEILQILFGEHDRLFIRYKQHAQEKIAVWNVKWVNDNFTCTFRESLDISAHALDMSYSDNIIVVVYEDRVIQYSYYQENDVFFDEIDSRKVCPLALKLVPKTIEFIEHGFIAADKDGRLLYCKGDRFCVLRSRDGLSKITQGFLPCLAKDGRYFAVLEDKSMVIIEIPYSFNTPEIQQNMQSAF